ncbi:MAG: hypothetical protein ACK5AV_06750 [Alphaproteobacteria bacterium]
MKDFVNVFANNNSLPVVTTRFVLIAGLGALASSKNPYKHLPKGELREFVKKYSPSRYLKHRDFADGWFKKNISLDNQQLYTSVSNIAMSTFIRSCLEAYVTNAIAERTGAPILTEMVAGMIPNGILIYLDRAEYDKKQPYKSVATKESKEPSLSEQDVIAMLNQMPTTILLNSMVSYNVIGVLRSAAVKICLDLWYNAKKAQSKNDEKIDLYSSANIYAYKCVFITTVFNLGFMCTGLNENKFVCDVVRKAIEEMVDVYAPKPGKYEEIGMS